MEICSLGKSELKNGLEVLCKGPLKTRSAISEVDARIIRIRSGVKRKKTYFCEAHLRKYVTVYSSHQRLCCDPFSAHAGASSKPKGVVEISLDMREKGKEKGLKLIPGQKVCVRCKFALYKKIRDGSTTGQVQSSQSAPSSSQTKSTESPATPGLSGTPSDQPLHKESPPPSYMMNLNLLNEALIANQEEPIDEWKLKNQRHYSVDQLDKFKKILERLKGGPSEDPFVGEEHVQSMVSKSALFDEILQQLQNHFNSCESRAEKIRALTVLPRSWPRSKFKEYFPVSSRMVKKAKKLVDEKGILSSPNRKAGRPLDDNTKKAVIDFYYRSDVSKELPGKNNIISIKEGGKRVHKMKRFVLANISHLHDEFCTLYPDLKISLSKFAFLRPRDCILADGCGMHNVCVCIIHQNPSLMFDGAHLQTITDFKKVTDCLEFLLCATPAVDCYLRTCKNCPDSSTLREKLEVAFDDDMVETVAFNQWESTDRSEILTKSCSVEEFIEDFITKLEALVKHHFIFKQQASFFRELQDSLSENEVIIVADFAENYTFIVQDSVQSFYFSNRQATIHPFSCYFRSPQTAKLEQLSFAVISDHMDHSTVAVYAFQRKLLEALRAFIPALHLVYWFSDGCAAQYKNKNNAANVWFHYNDFKIFAQWHYFATGHGKSACDGIGGSIKRLASLYSLRHTEPGSQITTPKQLFDWAVKGGISGVNCIWVPTDDVENAKRFLDVRFSVAKPLDGIRSCHAIVPCPDKNFVCLKKISQAAMGEEHKIVTSEMEVNFNEIKGYVTMWQRDQTNWQLAYVQDKSEISATVTLIRLSRKPGGRKNEFEFTEEEAQPYPVDCILTLAQPVITSKGRVIKLLVSDMTAADAILKKKKMEMLSS